MLNVTFFLAPALPELFQMLDGCRCILEFLHSVRGDDALRYGAVRVLLSLSTISTFQKQLAEYQVNIKA